MITGRIILLILAVICFLAAAFSLTSDRISWRDAGFACVTASLLV